MPVHSFKVLTTLAAQRIVAAVSGTSYTVQYPEDAQNLYLGISLDTVIDTTGAIPIAGPGEVAKLLFNDTVGSGQLVGSDTSGRGIPLSLSDTTTSVTLTSGYIGVLIGASVAATNTVAEVLIAPGLVRTSS